jgi:asparagine synthase (glutamine-hydrolysing)
LKKAMANHVPKEILYRRKEGFPNPAASWLVGDLKDMVADILLDSKSIARGYFRRSAVEELINRNCQSVRYTPEVFSLVVLELWHRTFLDPQFVLPNRTLKSRPGSFSLNALDQVVSRPIA